MLSFSNFFPFRRFLFTVARRGWGERVVWLLCFASWAGGIIVDELRAGRRFGGREGTFRARPEFVFFGFSLDIFRLLSLFSFFLWQRLSGTNVYFTNHHEETSRLHTVDSLHHPESS